MFAMGRRNVGGVIQGSKRDCVGATRRGDLAFTWLSLTLPAFSWSAYRVAATYLFVLLSMISTLQAVELEPPGKSSWPSFRHDLTQTGVASSTLPDPLEKLWEVALGDQILGAAAIVGDFVYVPCLSGELTCLKRLTGL